MSEQPTGPDLEFAHIEYITGSPDLQSSLVMETKETKFLNDMRARQDVDTQMFDNLRVYQGVLQCRIKVQEFDGHGYQVSQVMWEWRDVEVVT
tara:strand:+ start:1689 stop:1967 length:279 start_codon:yes stop_codon:yes gene_type:complete